MHIYLFIYLSLLMHKVNNNNCCVEKLSTLFILPFGGEVNLGIFLKILYLRVYCCMDITVILEL